MNNYRLISKKKPYKLTEEKEQQILLLREQKYSHQEIAVKLELSKSTVYLVCRYNGVNRIITEDLQEKYMQAKEIRKRYCNGEKYNDLRIEYNISGTNLTQILNNKRYYDKDYNPQHNPNNKNTVISVDIVNEMRKKCDAGIPICDIIDEYRHLYKSSATTCIRKICMRESFKNVL